MKPRLIIVSDLWGFEKSEWIKEYIKLLEAQFEIQFYDSCDLGQIDKTEYEETKLHHQFVNGGIEIAAKRLLELEKNSSDVLAFSIGGVIAWKAHLNGLKINNFYTVSSTRLRYENSKPNFQLKLYYGEKDDHLPSSDWFDNMGLIPKIYKNIGHHLYTEIKYIMDICNDIRAPYHSK